MPIKKPRVSKPVSVREILKDPNLFDGKELRVQAGNTTNSLFAGGCPSTCSVCGGQSYVRSDFPISHHNFGRVFPCPELPITSPKHDFDTGLVGRDRLHDWNEIVDRENMLEALQAVVSLLEKKRGFLLLHGGYGLGKTLLLKIAVTKVVESKTLRFARYRMFTDVFGELRRAFIEEGNFDQVLDAYAKYDLLALDEMGVAKETPFVSEQQFVLLNKRYEAAIERGENIMTIVATNTPLNELPPRLVDRFLDGRCGRVFLTGKSYRLGQTEES